MKKIIIGLVLLVTTVSFAQDCKYKRNEVDEFTKNIILETKEGVLTISGMGLGFSSGYSFKKINNNRYLDIRITSPSAFSLRKDDKIMFKTDSETTIDLFFSESIVANPTYNTTLKSTHWSENTLLTISDENYQRLLNENVLKVRINLSDAYVDDDVKQKHGKKLKELLKCIQ